MRGTAPTDSSVFNLREYGYYFPRKMKRKRAFYPAPIATRARLTFHFFVHDRFWDSTTLASASHSRASPRRTACRSRRVRGAAP